MTAACQHALAAALIAVVALSAGAQMTGASDHRLLLPRLSQAVPSDLSVRAIRDGARTRWLLGFTSAIDNVGEGPLVIEGHRRGGSGDMVAVQVIRRADGSTVSFGPVGRLRYDDLTGHHHWHLRGFDRYTLLNAGGRRLDRPAQKAGFCLGDSYQTVPGAPGSAPRFLYSMCGFRHPGLRRLVEGLTPGFGDAYPPFIAGQAIDITGLPAGTYVLANRVNPAGALQEASSAGDVASVRFSLRWVHRGTQLRVTVIRHCPGSAAC